MIFLLSLLTLLSSLSHASIEDLSLKRSWGRRLITHEEAQATSVFQTMSPLILPKKQVLQGSSFGSLYLINRYGRKKLIFDATEGLSGAPTVKGDFIFLGLLNKAALALNYKTQEILWRRELDAAPTAISEVANGYVFVQTESGSLYSLSASDGAINWKAQYKGAKDLNIYGDPKPILVGEDLVAGFESGHVVRLKQRTGQVVWERQLPGGRKYSDVQYLKIAKGYSLIAGVFDEAVYKLDLKSGAVQWQAFDRPVSDFSFDSEHLYFSSAEGELVKLRESTGTIIKKGKFFNGLGGAPIVVGNNIIVIDSKGPVLQVDRNSFESRFLYEFFHNITAGITYDKEYKALFILTNKGYIFRMKVLNEV